MPAIVLEDLPAPLHRALEARALRHGHSPEAEIQVILEAALLPSRTTGLGSLLAEIGREFGGVELDLNRDGAETPPVALT